VKDFFRALTIFFSTSNKRKCYVLAGIKLSYVDAMFLPILYVNLDQQSSLFTSTYALHTRPWYFIVTVCSKYR